MQVSVRFINFATVFCILSFLILLISCKGRTLDNVEPTGDTIEVVINQTNVADTLITNQ